MKYTILKIFVFCILIFSADASSTANLKLTSNIPKYLSISLDSAAVTLDLTTTKTDYKLASGTETSNSIDGYKVRITSVNLGQLLRSGGTERFDYQLKYGNQSLDLTTAQGHIISSNVYGVSNLSKDVQISYTGKTVESMVEGTYEDTITFEISAN
jgi:hypothetical protein